MPQVAQQQSSRQRLDEIVLATLSGGIRSTEAADALQFIWQEGSKIQTFSKQQFQDFKVAEIQLCNMIGRADLAIEKTLELSKGSVSAALVGKQFDLALASYTASGEPRSGYTEIIQLLKIANSSQNTELKETIAGSIISKIISGYGLEAKSLYASLNRTAEWKQFINSTEKLKQLEKFFIVFAAEENPTKSNLELDNFLGRASNQKSSTHLISALVDCKINLILNEAVSKEEKIGNLDNILSKLSSDHPLVKLNVYGALHALTQVLVPTNIITELELYFNKINVENPNLAAITTLIKLYDNLENRNHQPSAINALEVANFVSVILMLAAVAKKGGAAINTPPQSKKSGRAGRVPSATQRVAEGLFGQVYGAEYFKPIEDRIEDYYQAFRKGGLDKLAEHHRVVRAEALMKNGDTVQAFEFLKECTKREPGNPKYSTLFLRCLSAEPSLAERNLLLDELIKVKSNREDGDFILELLKLDYKKVTFQGGKVVIHGFLPNESTAIVRNKEAVFAYAAEVIAAKQGTREALDLLESATRLGETVPPELSALSLLLKAQLNSRRMPPEQFLQSLTTIADKYPTSAPIQKYLGQFYHWIGQYGSAQTQFERTLKLAPDDLATKFHLGVTFLELGDVKRAEPLIEIAYQDKNFFERRLNAVAELGLRLLREGSTEDSQYMRLNLGLRNDNQKIPGRSGVGLETLRRTAVTEIYLKIAKDDVEQNGLTPFNFSHLFTAYMKSYMAKDAEQLYLLARKTAGEKDSRLENTAILLQANHLRDIGQVVQSDRLLNELNRSDLETLKLGAKVKRGDANWTDQLRVLLFRDYKRDFPQF